MKNLLFNFPNKCLAELQRLQQSKLPVVLYGTGDYGRLTKKYLFDNGLEIAFCVVDSKYFKPDTTFEDLDIVPVENILEKHLPVNLVFAFDFYNQRMTELKTMDFLDCYVFDGLHFPGFSSEFIETHYATLENLYNSLADELSRQTTMAFIKAKNAGNGDDLLQLKLEEKDQYFPDFVVSQLTPASTFVDVGCFDGCNSLIFSRLSGSDKIIAFECDRNNLKKIQKNLAAQKDVRLIDKGAWSERTTLFFENSGKSNSAISTSGDFKIETETIDHICQTDNVSMIKMDIEGAELEALRGAEQTIIRDRPILAICVYHKQEDLITIPQYILSLHPDYKLYMRNYGYWQDETVLYAV